MGAEGSCVEGLSGEEPAPDLPGDGGEDVREASGVCVVGEPRPDRLPDAGDVSEEGLGVRSVEKALTGINYVREGEAGQGRHRVLGRHRVPQQALRQGTEQRQHFPGLGYRGRVGWGHCLASLSWRRPYRT